MYDACSKQCEERICEIELSSNGNLPKTSACISISSLSKLSTCTIDAASSTPKSNSAEFFPPPKLYVFPSSTDIL